MMQYQIENMVLSMYDQFFRPDETIRRPSRRHWVRHNNGITLGSVGASAQGRKFFRVAKSK